MSTNNRVVADIWLLTVSWTLTCEMIQIRNFYCFVYRQHIWLRKWEGIVWWHDWSCWDLWIKGGRGFVDVQRRSCLLGHKLVKLFQFQFQADPTFSSTFPREFPPGDLHDSQKHIILSNKFLMENPGGRLNKKDGLTRYGNSHVKDKTS